MTPATNTTTIAAIVAGSRVGDATSRKIPTANSSTPSRPTVTAVASPALSVLIAR